MIYVTAYRADDLDHPDKSLDSGFTSIMQVINAMGPPNSRPAPSVLVYGVGNDRVLFSRAPFNIDASDVKAYHTKRRGTFQ